MDIEEKKEYEYFISYFLSKNKYEQCWGRAVVCLKRKIKTYEDILEIEDMIKDDKSEQVTIMNYILM